MHCKLVLQIKYSSNKMCLSIIFLYAVSDLKIYTRQQMYKARDAGVHAHADNGKLSVSTFTVR